MLSKKKMTAVAVATTIALLGTACSGGGSDNGKVNSESGQTLVIWDYEADNSAMGKAWDRAVEIFQERHPDVTVKREAQTFEQIQKNAKIVLTGDQVPDVMEYNKGNATAGQLASQGLLTDLTDVAKERGWDKKLPESIAQTAKYDENGLMGSGNWYGIPNYGEFVFMYYNKKLFDEAGLQVPKTMDELVAVMDAFVAKGITPLAEAGSEYPMGQLWYTLALSKADSKFVRDYQFFDNPVQWTSGPAVEGAKVLQDWVNKGYINSAASGLTAEDMGTGFISGNYPMMFSGSWWFGRLADEMKDPWGQFVFPGNFAPGSSGNLWVVPENAKNKELAYEFIDITLSDEVQAIFGEQGGLPVVGGTDNITDEATKTLTDNFQNLAKDNKLAFYPDWPVAGFYDQLVSNMQSLMSGSKTPEQAMQDLQTAYEEGRADLLE